MKKTLQEYLDEAPAGTIWENTHDGTLWHTESLWRFLRTSGDTWAGSNVVEIEGKLYCEPDDDRAYYRVFPFRPVKTQPKTPAWPVKTRKNQTIERV